MGKNVLCDAGRLDDFLINKIVDLIIINQHNRVVFGLNFRHGTLLFFGQRNIDKY
jgi:hypothetical protein